MGASSTKQDTGTTSQQTSPWGPQAGALTNAFTGANSAYNTAQNAGTAPTEYTAGLTPDQIATFHQMIGYGGNSAIPGQQANAGSTLTGAGTNASTGALSALGAFNPASTNNANANIAGANAYVAGQDIPGQVAAAMRDANQNAHDITLPGMEANAAASGNINSSRTGVAEGIVQRGLDQQAGDLSATLRNAAFQHGADLTSNTNQNNNSAMLSALTGEAGAGNNAANTGLDASGQSISNQGNLFGLAGAGGQGLQGGNQATDTNAQQMFDAAKSNPFAALQNYMGIIGSNNWGSSSTGTSSATQTSTPSMLQYITGILGAGGSLAKGASGFKMPGG